MESPTYGLKPVLDYMDEICSRAAVYSLSNRINPPHCIINLESGFGQTHVTRKFAELYYKRGLREFHARDHYLEFCLDATREQIRRIFCEIHTRLGEYKNEPSGIVALDISKMAEYADEPPMDLLIKKLQEIADHVMFIFYVSGNESRIQNRMIKRIKEALGDSRIDQLCVQQYTYRELGMIALDRLKEECVSFQGDASAFLDVWQQKLKEEDIRSPKQAIREIYRLIPFLVESQEGLLWDYDVISRHINNELAGGMHK